MTGADKEQDIAGAAASKAAAIEGENIISLHAGYETDGLYMDGFLARPADGRPRPGVVLLSSMYGLTWKHRELTRYYARNGFVALSPDFMKGEVPHHLATGLHAKNSLDVESAVKAVIGGAAFLRSLPWVTNAGKVGVTGFCLGGGLALLALARSDVYQAGILYHHSLFPDMRELATISCKLQGHYATHDEPTPLSEVEAFKKTLDQLGKPHEIHIYEGMGHGFADVAPDADLPPAKRAAADLCHKRSFEFLHRELDA